ncbi:hypothetical protein [Campylobacter fetus]|uniref:hypothetical protein n=1 Tax=Campylobacter fetus TaxID=196 RepID=UPI003AF9A851
MVTKENLAQVLKLLEFKQNGDIFSKTYANDAVIKVDFKNFKIIYPLEIKKAMRLLATFLILKI